MSLTTAEKDRFDAEGYVVVRECLTDADLHPVVSEYEEFEEFEEFIDLRALRARELHAEGKIQDLAPSYKPHFEDVQRFSTLERHYILANEDNACTICCMTNRAF